MFVTQGGGGTGIKEGGSEGNWSDCTGWFVLQVLTNSLTGGLYKLWCSDNSLVFVEQRCA